MAEDRAHHHTFTDDPLDDSLVRIVIDTMSNDFAQVHLRLTTISTIAGRGRGGEAGRTVGRPTYW